MGDGMGVALSRARTVAWTRKVMVDSMSIFGPVCSVVVGSESWAWVVAYRTETDDV